MKFKYHGELELEIDLTDVAGEFLDGHNIDVVNGRLQLGGITIEKFNEKEVVKNALTGEILSWLGGQDIGVTCFLYDKDDIEKIKRKDSMTNTR